MIKDYTIISRKYPNELESAVHEYISSYGWQPFGGICIKGDYFYQAMVKYAKEP